MKWILLEEYKRYDLWYNTVGQYKESFKKGEDPDKEEEK